MSYFEDQAELAEDLGVRPFDGSPEMDQEIYDRAAARANAQDLDNDWDLDKKERREKKLRNKNFSTQLLIDKGISFTSHNNGVELRIKHNGMFATIWPSTGKYVVKMTEFETVYEKDRYKRGVYGLLKDLGVK